MNFFFPFLLFSTRYQVEDVAKACCDFLTKHLEPANVIGIARFAEEVGCTELHQRSREYINTHFSEVRRKVRLQRMGKKGLKCAQPVVSVYFSVLLCPQVTKEDEFFSLSHCQLLELISQDSLKVLCESEVCGVQEQLFFLHLNIHQEISTDALR